MARLSGLQIERLFRYYHFLTRHFPRRTEANAAVSSAELGAYLDVDPTLVRKDLAAVGIHGVPRVGYRASTAVRTIARKLGFTKPHAGVILGAGRLGSALAAYKGFETYGFRFVALFDIDPSKVGTEVDGRPVYHISELGDFVRREGIRLAVIAVPIPQAQEAAECAVKAGITAIWNFAHAVLQVPETVYVRHEHISTGLADLAYHLSSWRVRTQRRRGRKRRS